MRGALGESDPSDFGNPTGRFATLTRPFFSWIFFFTDNQTLFLEVHISFQRKYCGIFFSVGASWRFLFKPVRPVFSQLSVSALRLADYFPRYAYRSDFLCLFEHPFFALPTLFLAIPGGIMLDAWLYQPLCTHVLMLVIVSFAANLISERFPLQKMPIASIVFSCTLATIAFVLMKILFFAGGLTPAARLALLPKYFLLGLIVNALAAGPVLFATMGFLERIFSRPKHV